MAKRGSTEGAWMVGTDAVIQWYMDMAPDEAPYYSVWSKMPRVLKFSFDLPDKGMGAELLRSNLQPAQDNQMDQVLVIRLHKVLDKNGITDRSAYWASTDFRLVPLEEYEPMAMTGYGSPFQSLSARISALEAGGATEEKPSIMGAIQGLIDTPEVRPVIAAAIAGFLSRLGILPQQSLHAMANPASMNGFEEDSQDLPVTQKDLELMGRLSRDNPEMFTTLINQLRAMYATEK